MKEFVFTAKSPDELDGIASKIIQLARDVKVLIFYGEMGAGKTTLIKAICKSLGVKDVVTSPTFSILNEYKDGNDQSIYHFDFYRIKNETEAYDIGYENYFFSGNLCLVEWPERINSLLNCTLAKITIEVIKEQRIIKIVV